MAISDRIVSLTQSRNTLRNKMVAAGQATSNDKLEVLVENLTIDSSGDGISIKVITNEESKYGKTVTISQGTKTYTSVFSDTGEAAFGSVDFQNGTIIVTCEGAYSEFEITVDYELYLGFTYKDWLKAGDIIPEEYSSLDEVLADEKAIRKLMTLHSSVDYLAIFSAEDVNIVTILTDDYCAKWINLRDYALDTLYAAYKDLMDEIDKYGYGEWALMPQVPTMTSNTAPYGEVKSGSIYSSSYQAFYAFDNNDSTFFNPTNNTLDENTIYLQYAFSNPITVKRIGFKNNVDSYTTNTGTFVIKASNDGSNWTSLGEFTWSKNTSMQYFDVDNNIAYTYYRFVATSYFTDTRAICVKELQFYAWQPKGNVPVMTSNTAPWGTLTTDYSPYAGTAAYRMFDDNETTQYYGPTSGDWLHYTHKLVNPLCIKRIKFRTVVDTSGTLVLKGSNDGSSYVELLNKNLDKQTMFHDYNIDTDQYYLYYYFEITGSNKTPEIYTMQYYGRELKVSVPTMSSNTAPYGEVIYDSQYNSNQTGYIAFDGNNSRYWCSNNQKPNYESAYIGYKFTSPVRVKSMSIMPNSNNESSVIYIEASNTDKTSGWTRVSSDITISGTAISSVSLSISDAYLSYRVRFVSQISPGNSYVGNINMLQFYGFDYSEYDWDENNPRHYVYDHGVMVDSDGFTNDQNTQGTVVEEPDHIYISVSGKSQHTLLCPVNFNDYNLIRLALGLEKNVFSNVLGFGVIESKTEINSIIATKKFNAISASELKYNSFLDVSSVNTNKYVYVGHVSSENSYTDSLSIQELWLE